jgi:hypothetical protein
MDVVKPRWGSAAQVAGGRCHERAIASATAFTHGDVSIVW